MESPDSTDAAAYAANLKLLGDLMPAMPPDARSRAALDIARSKANIAEAVARQGYDLHGAAGRTAAPARTPAPKPPRVLTAAEAAAQGRRIAALEADLAAMANPAPAPAPAAPDFPNEHDHVRSDDPTHRAAIKALESGVCATYAEALLLVSRKRRSV